MINGFWLTVSILTFGISILVVVLVDREILSIPIDPHSAQRALTDRVTSVNVTSHDLQLRLSPLQYRLQTRTAWSYAPQYEVALALEAIHLGLPRIKLPKTSRFRMLCQMRILISLISAR